MTRPALSIDAVVAGIAAEDRSVLARAITLVESQRPEDRAKVGDLVTRLLPRTGRAIRVGITGVPGVGKSTLIDALGAMLLTRGFSVAVLAIDPSSNATGGSILADKTRMPRLAGDPRAFVRPSPSGGELGGVARRTREASLVCEAFGFDVIVIETVGVGQSETAVADMVDTFVLLALPGAGDELQGIKRGIMEMADLVAVNKADGDNASRARRAAKDLVAALRYQRRRHHAWEPRVLTVSALTGAGISDLWAAVTEHRTELESTGDLGRLRAEQAERWMWQLIEEGLRARFERHPAVSARLREIATAVESGRVPAGTAADELLALFDAAPR
jgi:LAO/AO transport system kinase